MPDTGYSVCWDTTNNGVCDTVWWPNGGGTTRVLQGMPAGVYYWQVRAQTPGGMIEADGGVWWSVHVSALEPEPSLAEVPWSEVEAANWTAQQSLPVQAEARFALDTRRRPLART